LGYIGTFLGDFFRNPSVHPACAPLFERNISKSKELSREKLGGHSGLICGHVVGSHAGGLGACIRRDDVAGSFPSHPGTNPTNDYILHLRTEALALCRRLVHFVWKQDLKKQQHTTFKK
jgi:hypothetical protein